MGSDTAGHKLAEGAEIPLEQLLRRAAAYGFLTVSAMAMAVVAVVLGLLTGWKAIVDALRHPLSDTFWMLALAFPAAALGAAAVHRPFLRALQAGSVSAVHRWTLTGVLAAHAAYAGLNAVVIFASESYPTLHLFLTYRLEEAGFDALLLCVISLFFGFLPNASIALAFAEFLLWRRRKKKLLPPASAIHSILEGGNHARTTPAE